MNAKYILTALALSLTTSTAAHAASTQKVYRAASWSGLPGVPRPGGNGPVDSGHHDPHRDDQGCP